MNYELYIGDRTFSSWSYRGWLLLEKFGLNYTTHVVGLYAGTMASEMAHLAPAKTVPTLRTGEGHILTDSFAMAETLAEAHPEIDFWPRDPAARALARSITAEMHSSFMALREDCPNIISHVWIGFEPSAAVLKDVARIEYLWDLARDRHGKDGPWLFGEYSIADVFYAPVTFRMTTYRLPISKASHEYVNAHLKDPAFAAWKAEADKEVHDPFPYDFGMEKLPWPA